jgi:hypothetical protein
MICDCLSKRLNVLDGVAMIYGIDGGAKMNEPSNSEVMWSDEQRDGGDRVRISGSVNVAVSGSVPILRGNDAFLSFRASPALQVVSVATTTPKFEI